MLRMRGWIASRWIASRWIAAGLLLAAPFLLAHALLAQTGHPTAPAAPAPAAIPVPVATPVPAAPPGHHSHKTANPPKLELPPAPRGLLSQLPMEQIPATPAKVSYEGGFLTISAQNATMGEILRDVRKLTGATIEIPQGAGANERVVTSIGPGAPRDVLAVLLNGSSFNYVMLGSSSDPSAVSSVMLTAKPSSSGETPVGPSMAAGPMVFDNGLPMRPGANPPMIRPTPAQPGGAAADDDSKDDDDKDDDDSADDQPKPGQPDATGSAAEQPQQPADPNQPNAGPKTPEQILEMMRRPPQPGSPFPQQQPPQPPQQ